MRVTGKLESPRLHSSPLAINFIPVLIINGFTDLRNPWSAAQPFQCLSLESGSDTWFTFPDSLATLTSPSLSFLDSKMGRRVHTAQACCKSQLRIGWLLC